VEWEKLEEIIFTGEFCWGLSLGLVRKEVGGRYGNFRCLPDRHVKRILLGYVEFQPHWTHTVNDDACSHAITQGRYVLTHHGAT
jgi:hypothetical protein